MDDLSVDAAQTESSPLKLVRQTLVVNAEEVEERDLKIVHVNGVLRNVVGELVGLAAGYSALDAATCHPHGERTVLDACRHVALVTMSLCSRFASQTLRTKSIASQSSSPG